VSPSGFEASLLGVLAVVGLGWLFVVPLSLVISYLILFVSLEPGSKTAIARLRPCAILTRADSFGELLTGTAHLA
jgi:hypothetical protein